MPCRLICCLFSLFWLGASAQTYTPGQSYFGANSYTEYVAGNLPIILSAPHGGLLAPAAIPDRACSGCSTVNDYNTQELARAVAAAIYNRTGCYPHLVINRLHRRKLDANREIVEAAQGNALAEQAWYDFNAFLDTAALSVENRFAKGLYIDLHGHAHTIQRLEMGYLLSKSELQLPDSALNTVAYVDQSSIKHLTGQNAGDLPHAALLRGPEALGSRMAARGYPAVPSLADPYPAAADSYFNGGYNTDRHGSANGGVIDGIQIECNRTGIRDSLSQVMRFADSLAVTLLEYLEQHYFGPATTGLCATTGVSAPVVQVFPNPYCQYFTLQYDTPAVPLTAELYDFYGMLLRVMPVEPGIPVDISLKSPQNLFVLLRRTDTGAVVAMLPVFYCR